jgi:hypothetical protein
LLALLSCGGPAGNLKKSILFLSFSLTLLCTKTGAQIVLDDFTAGTQIGEGAAIAGSSWVDQVTQNATTITIAGTAHGDNGWGVFNLTPFDASAMHSIAVTGQLDAGNAALTFNVQFFDNNYGAQAFSIDSSAFLTGSLTTVSIPIGSWSGIDPTHLDGWTIGGGDFVTNGPDFRMTLDQLALSPSAVPEPGTSAALAGLAALGFAVWRRRAVRTD